MIPSQFLGERATRPKAAAGRVFDRHWSQYVKARRPPLDEPRIVGFGVDPGDRHLTVCWMMPNREVRFVRLQLGSNIIEHPSGNGFLAAHPAHPVVWIKWDGRRETL